MKKLLTLFSLLSYLSLNLFAQYPQHRYWITGQDTIVKDFNYKYKYSTTSGLHQGTQIKWQYTKESKDANIEINPDSTTNAPFYPRGIILTPLMQSNTSLGNTDEPDTQIITLTGSAGFLKDAEKNIVIRDIYIYPSSNATVQKRSIYYKDSIEFEIKYIPSDASVLWETSTYITLVSGQGKSKACFKYTTGERERPGTVPSSHVTATIKQGNKTIVLRKTGIIHGTYSSSRPVPLMADNTINSPYSIKIFSFPSNIIIYQKNNITDFNIEDANLKTGNIYIIHKTYKDGTTSSEKIIKK